jgi:hypothetical protein
MSLYRKLQQLALGPPPHRAWQARIEESDDGPEHPVGGAGVPAMQAQHPPGPEAHHDDSIDMGDDSDHVPEAEQAEAGRQVIGAHNP